ncbi:hypothetical protein BJ138DRAFT_167560 [Hygrophoropsis aurantiaca]|uniref:Uncharacterized protein n=1 Tax=Hygrophoropsis aurantiaca TaxID=72124 RepID=A0ACB8A8Z3_9AGAM|nr:hypothetical protein BJ138DRAFT_167560 [Hygrophoropsis aurantiaca]
MLQNLPFEILCKIIAHLPTINILTLRQVSKYLNQVTHDRLIWAHAYRTSSLVRPQGPFAWQTAHVLESSLVQSTRLSSNWPPNPNAAPIRSHTTSINELKWHFHILCGRWLLMKAKNTQILWYDLDRTDNSETEESYSILYKSPDKSIIIEDFHCESTSPGERSGLEDRNSLAFLVMVESTGEVPVVISFTFVLT